jgi:hypothetical protein
MPARFLPDDGRYLLRKGLRPETWRVFFELNWNTVVLYARWSAWLSLSQSAEENGH